MKEYYICNAKPEEAYNNFVNSKPIRDIYLDFIEAIAETDENYAEILAENFEYMYNKLTCIKTFNTSANSASSGDFDIYKNLLWELFICAIVYMRHIKDYAAINVLLTYTYFLETNAFGGAIRQNNYTAFRYHSTIVEEVYKPGTEMKNKFTLMGDTICNQREKLPVYTSESIAEADLFLYQVCNAYDLADDGNRWHDTYWFPTCYVYAKKGQLEWEKMKSRRYCKKMQLLFSVDNIDELKEKIGKCVHNSDMKYSGSWDAAPAILDWIKIDDIGTLN